ncbi:MAG: GNAT family N-acetyltransferase [Eubacteriales bacterium]
MKYYKKIILKNGNACILRNGDESDGQAVLENFNQTHAETDFLLSYPDENSFDAMSESRYLKGKTESENEIEIIAEIDGAIAGTAGIDAVGSKYKVRHRAEFGISVAKDYWEIGIGWALTEACIECAREAGYRQLELNVVADNKRAVAMYERAGFVEYGRNPMGFNSRTAGYQELILMRLEL